MKTAIIIVVIFGILLIAAVRWRNARRGPTAEELTIRDLVREVYGTHITSEQFVHKGSDLLFMIELQDEKLAQLEINLSSLARKHKEGATLAALKASLRFD